MRENTAPNTTLDEPTAPVVRRLLGEAEVIIASDLTLIECPPHDGCCSLASPQDRSTEAVLSRVVCVRRTIMRFKYLAAPEAIEWE